MSDDKTFKVKSVPKINVTGEDDQIIFTTTVLAINSLVAESQVGLDRELPQYVELLYTRLANGINDKYKCEISPEQAYQIGTYAMNELQGLKGNF